MKKLNTILSVIFYLILILEYFLILGNIFQDKKFSHFLEIQLFVVYIASLIIIWRLYGFNSLFSIFLLCLGLFNFQRIFWGYFLDLDYRMPDVSLYPALTEITVQKTLYFYTVFTFTLTHYYSRFDREYKEKKTNNNYGITTDRNLIRIGKYLIIFFLPFVFYRGILEFVALIGRSFTDIYAENAFIDIPWYLKISSIFFQLGFMMLLGGKPPIKTFYIFGFIYLITFVPNLLIGLRAMFAVGFLFLFWYYTNIYNKKINIIKTLIFLFSIILLLQYIAFIRVDSETETNLFRSMLTFLISQSQSMYVLSYYIQYEDIVNNINTYPYLLDPFISWAFPSGQSLDVLNVRSALGHQLTYVINPDYYLGGASLGTSFIADIYEFGLLGVFIGAIIFSFFISSFNKLYYKKKIIFIFSMFFVQYFFMAPRSTFLPNIYFLVRYLVIFIFIYFLFDFKNGIFSKKKLVS